MPFIRYTYEPDVAVHGDKPVHVLDVEARVLTEMRRAVLVEPEAVSKADLLEVAKEVGADVPKNASKAKLAEAVAEAGGQ